MNPDNPNFREPLSREQKLADGIMKKIDAYIHKHGLDDKTLLEVNGVFKHLITEFGKKVSLNEYCKHK